MVCETAGPGRLAVCGEGAALADAATGAGGRGAGITVGDRCTRVCNTGDAWIGVTWKRLKGWLAGGAASDLAG